MTQPIIYFEIVGDDAALLRSYYSKLFGWRFDTDAPPRGFEYASVRADGVGVGGAIGAAPPGTGGYVTFYVEVNDVEATLARAEHLGGKRIFGPDSVSDTLELGMFKDPEGHLVGLRADPGPERRFDG
jgi:predicted enzyme related to lactoylglutathione lyase